MYGSEQSSQNGYFAAFRHPGYPWNPGQHGWPGWLQPPTPGPLNLPEPTGSGPSQIPGGHTARFTKSDGSRVFAFRHTFHQKSVRRRNISGLHTAHLCSKRTVFQTAFIDFSVFSRVFRARILAPCSAILLGAEESDLLVTFCHRHEWGRLNPVLFSVIPRVFRVFPSFPGSIPRTL